MPGFFSWLSAFFTPSRSAVKSENPRLLNPTSSTSKQDEPVSEATSQQLEEHLFNWLLDAPPTALNRELDANERSALNVLQRRINEQSLQELPRQPMTLPMLTRALSNDNVDRKDLSEIILSDPALTDQLLHVANNPMFRPGRKSIESVDQAVFLLGVNGIRNVISAAVMRPMMTARNSREALFAQRVWLWGLTCAKAAELIAGLKGRDGSIYFMTGLLPALSYITLHREILRICQLSPEPQKPSPNLTHQALTRFQWATAQILANEWKLSPEYHAKLLEAERPKLDQTHAPLNDGIIMGTREILLHARQKNITDEEVLNLVRVQPEQFVHIRRTIIDSLKAGPGKRA